DRDPLPHPVHQHVLQPRVSVRSRGRNGAVSGATPTLDGRRARVIVRELLERAPAYARGWAPTRSGATAGVLEVVARYARSLIERLSQAPDKNRLAFLDFLGIGLLPAQAARAPVVFKSLPNVADSRAPARTRVGAAVPGSDAPLVFETEDAIALPKSQLVTV